MPKKKLHPILKILLVLFVFYVILYALAKTGYYDKRIKDKTTFTQEKIQEFENDIAQGETINMGEYLPKKEDYANILTKSANAFTHKLSLILTNNSDNIIAFFKALFIG